MCWCLWLMYTVWLVVVNGRERNAMNSQVLVYDMIYLLTAVWLARGGSNTVHTCTQTINRTTQNKQYIEQYKNFGIVRAVPRLGELYLPYNWAKRKETPQKKMTRNMMATVPYVASSSELRKFQAAWFFLNRGYTEFSKEFLTFWILNVSWYTIKSNVTYASPPFPTKDIRPSLLRSSRTPQNLSNIIFSILMPNVT
jgi:hypothetical protein